MVGMCELPCQSTEELSDLTAVVVCCWTSFRAEDLHSLLSKNLTKLNPSEKAPRMWKFYLETMKNDPAGNGLAQDREFFIPCICLESLKTANQIKNFKKDLNRNPDIECPCPCPYQKVKEYMDAIPDPYGRIAESANLPPLRFMRAKTTTGSRRFITSCLGK